MRIVAGRHRGRRLAAPEGLAVRPTGERIREALFGILVQGRLGGGSALVPEARVLDAFAGTGALGLEALSRGAGHVTFMESQPTALATLKRNLAALGETEQARVLRCDVLRPPPPDAPCSLVLMDPPYNQGLGPPALVALQSTGWLEPGALAVIELLAKEPFDPPTGFTPLDERKYGKARLVFLRAPTERG